MIHYLQQLLYHRRNYLLVPDRLLQGKCENDKIKINALRHLENVLFLKYFILNNVYFFQFPLTTEEWLKHGESFDKQWNILHCLGAMDGMHTIASTSQQW